MRSIRPIDCTCDGVPPLCAVCLVRLAFTMRRQHPDSLSVSMLKRRIPKLAGREAALLLEATRRL
jgi:hypothetical protein